MRGWSCYGGADIGGILVVALDEYAKNIDKRTGGMVRQVYWFFRYLACWPQLLKIRWKVKKAVGSDVFKSLNKIHIATIPNQLSRANSLYQIGYALEKILLVCNLRPKQFNPWKEFSFFVNWQDLTVNTVDPGQYLKAAYQFTGKEIADEKLTYFNFDCPDISKKKIGEIHEKILGYPLDIDPLTFKGPVAKKSNGNALHDGEVITCPIPKEEIDNDCVYSILVDNVIEGQAADFRMVYINGILDFFYDKRRNVEYRFDVISDNVAIRKTREEFSEEEIALVERFCEELGADYGELDVLRDRKSGRIYIVDFAKTPFGPPPALPRKYALIAIETMSIAFINNVLKKMRPV